MTALTFWRHLRRETRGERTKILFFVLCLALGVGAVVSVAGFCEGLDRGIRSEAKQLLAADLTVSGRRPLSDDLRQAISELGELASPIRSSQILEMLTLVATADHDPVGAAANSLLVELKSLDGVYPFYGELELEPARPLSELLSAQTAIVAPEVLSRLDLRIGDHLRIGGEDFQIAGSVIREPDRIAGAFSMGPRLFLNAAGLKRAGLEKFGSRILYRTLVQLPGASDETVAAAAEALRQKLPGDGRYRVETYREAQPALRQGIDRMARYLGLAALLSLLIGGVGIAQTVRAWLAGRIDSIAILKCLGYRPQEVFWLYLGQIASLGLFGSLLGMALGAGLQLIAVQLLVGVLPVELIDPWQPGAMLRGLLLGVGVSLLFSAAPLATVRRVPPIRVLRRDAQPLPPSRLARWISVGTLILGLFALAAWQAASWQLGLAFTGGLLLITGLLTLAARALMRLTSRPRARARLWLRQGLAALSRPGAASLGAIVALGLGVLVVLAIYVVERQLGHQLDRDVPQDAPSAFLIDIQPDQWDGVRTLLEDADSLSIDSVPVVMGRINAIDGRSAEEVRQERMADPTAGERGDDGDAWELRREQRLTYLDKLPADNEIIAGSLWNDPNAAEISIEQEFAEQLEVSLDSVIRFDVQGVLIDLTVTSIRKVDWNTFGINFYLVAEPEVFVDAPQHRIAAARLPDGREQWLQDQLAAAYPNITMIRLRDVLVRLADILSRLALGVRLLGGLTVAAGLAILIAAVSAQSLRRGQEVALLKTLGFTRRQVILSFATEYGLIGLVAGLIGGIGGTALAWWVLNHGMDIPWTPEALSLLLAVLGSALLAITAGLVASVQALRKRPVAVLRSL